MLDGAGFLVGEECRPWVSSDSKAATLFLMSFGGARPALRGQRYVDNLH